MGFAAICLALISIGGTVEAKLVYTPYASTDDMASGAIPTVAISPWRGQIPSGYSAPPGKKDFAFTTFYGLDDERPLVGLTTPDSAWIDWNRNGKFEASEQASHMAQSARGEVPEGRRGVQFTGTYKAYDLSGQPAKLKSRHLVLLVKGNEAVFAPIGRWIATVAGAKVEVTDYDGDGILKTTAEKKWSLTDELMVELDGKVGPVPPGSIVELSDGRLLKFDVDDLKQTVRATETKPDAIIDFGAKVASRVKLRRPEGIVLARATDGKAHVPAGTYEVSALALEKDSWRCEFSGATMNQVITVGKGETAIASFGEDLELDLRAVQSGDTATISLVLKGRDGSAVSGVTKPDGRQPAEPRLVIRDSNGKLVDEVPFHYG